MRPTLSRTAAQVSAATFAATTASIVYASSFTMQLKGASVAPPRSPPRSCELSSAATRSDPNTAAPLTRREYGVAQLVARALSNKEIARELALSEFQGEASRPQYPSKMGAATRGELMRCMRDDLWPVDPAERVTDTA